MLLYRRDLSGENADIPFAVSHANNAPTSHPILLRDLPAAEYDLRESCTDTCDA